MKKTTIILLLIALCLVLSCCSVSAYNYPDSRRYTAGGAKVTGRVENLDVSWISGTVNIGYHDGNGVLLSEESDKRLKTENELHWWLDGDTLYVKYAESGFRGATNLNKELTVLLPDGTDLDAMTVNVVSASLRAEDVSAESLKINTVSGSVYVTADRADKVEVNSVSGAQTLRFVREPEKLKADSVSGSVSIALPANAGFTANIDTVSGRVNGSIPMQKDGHRYTSGNGACRITVNTVSGNVYLDELK